METAGFRISATMTWEAVVLPIYESCIGTGIIAERNGKFNHYLSKLPTWVAPDDEIWYHKSMKLSEELKYRGFVAETTIENIEDLDTRESKKFYWGADPSADSLTIGNLAALM